MPVTVTMNDEQRHLAEIEGLQREYDVAESEWEQAKDIASAKKKIAEEKARKLFRYVRDLSRPTPLFDVWRQTPIAELGLSDGIVAILNENGLDTVGKLADYTNAGKKLTDLSHFGEKKADSVREAMEWFWRDHKTEGELPPEAPESPTEPE